MGTEHPAGRLDAVGNQSNPGLTHLNSAEFKAFNSLKMFKSFDGGGVIRSKCLCLISIIGCMAMFDVFVFLLIPARAFCADKIRISYSGPSVSNALLWVTQEGKLFDKNGLDVEVLYLAGSLGQSALLANETQLAVYTGLLLTPARLQGADVVMVASFLDHLLSRLVVRPDIRSAADLKGKKLGVTRFGTASDFGMRLIVSRLGLNPDTDVAILQIGDNPMRVAALQTKIIDGAIFDPPDYKKAVEAGGHILMNLEEVAIPYQHAGLVTTKKFIATRPDIVKRAVQSIIEGAALVRRDPETAKRALAKRLRIKDERELDETYQLLRAFTRSKPYPSMEGFRAILGDLAKKLPAAKSADPKDFVDSRFIEELDKSGYIATLQ
jgi:ABC-type nitrate/sulfonate/bicarbonate transport system substrate-binding protein